MQHGCAPEPGEPAPSLARVRLLEGREVRAGDVAPPAERRSLLSTLPSSTLPCRARRALERTLRHDTADLGRRRRVGRVGGLERHPRASTAGGSPFLAAGRRRRSLLRRLRPFRPYRLPLAGALASAGSGTRQRPRLSPGVGGVDDGGGGGGGGGGGVDGLPARRQRHCLWRGPRRVMPSIDTWRKGAGRRSRGGCVCSASRGRRRRRGGGTEQRERLLGQVGCECGPPLPLLLDEEHHLAHLRREEELGHRPEPRRERRACSQLQP